MKPLPSWSSEVRWTLADPTLVIVGHQAWRDDTAKRFKALDVRTTERRGSSEAFGSASYVLIEHRTGDSIDELDDLLDRLHPSGVSVGIVFQGSSQELLLKILLSHGCLHLVAENDLTGEHVASITARMNVPSPDQYEEPFRIGALIEADSDLSGYEEQRSLPLISPAMERCVAELRAALDVMKRRVKTGPPWDPTNSLANGFTITNGIIGNQPSKGLRGKINLRDVFDAHRDKGVLELLAGEDKLRASLPNWNAPPTRLLLTGPSGTGKTFVANLLHRVLTADNGGTIHAPFERIFCGGFSVGNFDHEMFGSPPGSWTGIGAVPGVLARAAYGTAFFDELGDLPLETQTRLLTFLDDLMIRPTGMRPFFGFMQVIAATNRDLNHQIAVGTFRHDLLARFHHRVELPALAERSEEERRRLIDFAAQDPRHNLAKEARGGGRIVTHIEAAAMDRLAKHGYRQENFRELERVVAGCLRRAAVDGSKVIRVKDVEAEFADQRESHRPEAVANVVNINAAHPADKLPEDLTWIELESIGELLRLAGRRDLSVLRGTDPRSPLVALDGRFAYAALPASEPLRSDPDHR